MREHRNAIVGLMIFMLLLVGVAWAARTALTPDSLPAVQKVNPAAGANDVTMNSSDNVNGNEFACTGREILVIENDDAATQTLTVSTKPDAWGRTGTLTYALAADDVAVFGPMDMAAWAQSDGNIDLDTTDADVKIGVVKVNALR